MVNKGSANEHPLGMHPNPIMFQSNEEDKTLMEYLLDSLPP